MLSHLKIRNPILKCKICSCSKLQHVTNFKFCRHLANDKKNGMHQLTKRVMRRLGVMAPVEDFNSEEWKSKLIFFTTQGLYSILVSLPTMWLYSSYSLRFNKDSLIIKRDLETIEEFVPLPYLQ